MLNEINGISCPLPTGAFYVYPSVKKLIGKNIKGKVANTSAELANMILDEAEVAAVPGEAFGPSGYLRFSYALGDADIVTGITKLKTYLES
jgi:aspartate/methionine/tyrosine aminotransferase